METILTYTILFGLGFYLGWKVNDIFIRMTFSKMLKDAGVDSKDLDKFVEYWRPKMEGEETQELPYVEIRLEQHNETFYAYRKDTEEFLGQGRDKEELINTIKARFKNGRFILHKDDGGELLQNTNS